MDSRKEEGLEKENLVKKIGWVDTVRDFFPSDMQYISLCKKLEENGFGMLADKTNHNRIDGNDSVVFPNGEVLTSKQIIDYWEGEKRKFNPKDKENLRMFQAYIYYAGFRQQLNAVFSFL